jgi:hypothetical protein
MSKIVSKLNAVGTKWFVPYWGENFTGSEYYSSFVNALDCVNV